MVATWSFLRIFSFVQANRTDSVHSMVTDILNVLFISAKIIRIIQDLHYLYGLNFISGK